jgi:hypothetical protein
MKGAKVKSLDSPVMTSAGHGTTTVIPTNDDARFCLHPSAGLATMMQCHAALSCRSHPSAGLDRCAAASGHASAARLPWWLSSVQPRLALRIWPLCSASLLFFLAAPPDDGTPLLHGPCCF